MILENFKLVQQEKVNTCGYAAAAMVVSFLEHKEFSEEDFAQIHSFDPEKGIGIMDVMEVYKKTLTEYSAQIIYGSQEEMIKKIDESLQKNIPLHILYYTENLMTDSSMVLHYAVLIGFDKDENHYVIADPYGSFKNIQAGDFFCSISFRNEGLPDIVKQKFPSNMMIAFTKN